MIELAPLSPKGKGADDPHPGFRKKERKGIEAGAAGRRRERAGLIQYDGNRTSTEHPQRHPAFGRVHSP